MISSLQFQSILYREPYTTIKDLQGLIELN